MKLDHEACYRALSARDPRFDGRFFVAVSTTGIYCRPICPARTPQRGHVTFYPTAAAAQEAGYRPCLRCRPETAPNIGAWRGTSNTVSRALTLIETGALDDCDVEALASRLGVGGRQLRRLFQEHVGASPLAVAQTRRILLAKQLIHETGLPMTEVALAAGFGSTRRFNDIFRRLFGRAPSALRRRGAARDGSAIELTLAYRPPYDWDAIIGFLAARAIPGIESVTPTLYCRSFAGGCIAVSHEPERRRLRVAVRLADTAELPSILLRVRRVFDLGADPETIAAHLSRDPALAPLLKRRPGLRLPGGWDGFEMAVRAVIGQQITIAGARQLLGKLVAAYGARIDGGANGLTHVFPTPDRLIGQEIAALGMPAARGRAITNLAQAVLADPSLFERAASLEDAIAKLCAVPGIGDWTAHYIAIRALREPDAFPSSDIGLLRALAEDGVRPTPKQVQARAEAWRPWRAYAAQHLWTEDFSLPPLRGREEIERDSARFRVGGDARSIPPPPPPLEASGFSSTSPSRGEGKKHIGEGQLNLVLDKLPSPIGTILLVCDGEAIRALDFEDYEPRFKKLLRRHVGDAEIKPGKAPRAIREGIRAYFAGDIRALDKLGTATGGTEFQRAVWKGLRKIPAGKTWSYSDLAEHVGRPAARRAVGLANGSNPIAIVVPCHRVIGADGSLTGYGGGMSRKRWLLRHEGVAVA